MAKYLIEYTIANQNYADLLKNPENRLEVLRPIFKAAGCNLEEEYASGIENKAYMIVESPDLNSVWTVGANFMASGSASSVKYIPLITVPDSLDMIKKAASLGYRRPGK